MEKVTQPAAPDLDYPALASQIKHWGMELGFQQVGISDTELGEHETYLLNWLDQGRQGEMDYMQRHGTRRSRPAELLPGTLRVIRIRWASLCGTDSKFPCSSRKSAAATTAPLGIERPW